MRRDLRFALLFCVALPALILTRPLDNAATASASRPALIHTVVPSECNTYHNWQVLGQFWSWKKVGSPGMFSRIACCDMDTLKGQQSVNPYQVYYTETQRDPEGIGDDYIPYNKPYGVMSWLENIQPAGDYFLIVDPDMTFHRWFTIDELGAGSGWGAAQGMWYMKELNQFIAQKLLPSQQGSMGSIKRRLLQKRAETAYQEGSMGNVERQLLNQMAEAALQQGSLGSSTKQILRKKRLLPARAAQLALVNKSHADGLTNHPHLQAVETHQGTHHGSRKLHQEVMTDVQAPLQLADEVGEIYVYAASDLKRVAPLWWEYTKQMRIFHEKYAQELPADTPIRRPWIAEMYAIALGAAQLGIRHRSYNNIVMHPPNAAGALNKEGPNMIVSHYAWNAEVPSMNWKWNKHAFKTNWSALACPPWNLDEQFSRTAWGEFYNGSHGGLFPHPPLPSELTNKAPGAVFQDLANIEMVAMLNEGFCELHHKPYCPPSEELSRECGKATRVMQELAQFYKELANGSSIFCLDAEYCAEVEASPKLATLCQESPAKDQCYRTCNLCHTDFDSSNVVWYNQPHTQAAGVIAGSHDTSFSDVASSSSSGSSSSPQQKLADLSGKEGIGAGTAKQPLDDPPDRRLNDVISEETARPRTYLDGIVDTMLQQQADVKTATNVQDTEQFDSAARQDEGRKSVVASMLAHIASMSEGDQSSVAAHGTPITKAIMQRHGHSLIQSLSNPLCFGLLLLCVVLILCVLWLTRTRSRRRKSASQ